MIQTYAKKIFGFAVLKTGNLTQAQDLSQEILCALVDALRRHDRIADLDGFVYTVSNYTWIKFLRGNKRYWNNLDLDLLAEMQSADDTEGQVVAEELLERLRTEIAYLSRLHREIVVMFYYDNKTGAEIAESLQIPHSTVRWHLREIKQKLKGVLEMEQSLSYRPKQLWAGHDGWAKDMNMHGLGHNPLVDNICVACYGKTLNIEELSRELRVAAAYIEPLVEDLFSMDYLTQPAKGRYSTNFFIQTKRFRLVQAAYKFHHIGAYAEKLFDVYQRHFNEICSIGFAGSDLDRNFLLWALLPLTLQDLYYKSLEFVFKKNRITIDTPLRKDGTRHWVSAGYKDEAGPEGFTDEEKIFLDKSNGHGIKTRGDEGGLHSLQYDGYATIQIGIDWREFGSYDDLRGIQRIAALQKSMETPNDYDKAMIASFIEAGYCVVEDGKPRLLIPYLNAEEYIKFSEILSRIYNECGETLFAEFIEGFAAEMEKEIPAFISKEERIYHKYAAYPQYAVLYWLSDSGFLRYPDKEEAKRLCTVVWCTE